MGKKYCGSLTTMGHGEYARCGEKFYHEIYQCNRCKIESLQSQLTKVKEENERLKCCGNCNNKPYADGIGQLEPRCQYEDDCFNNEHWESKK